MTKAYIGNPLFFRFNSCQIDHIFTMVVTNKFNFWKMTSHIHDLVTLRTTKVNNSNSFPRTILGF